MNSLRLSILLTFFAPLAACAQEDTLISQLIRIEPTKNNRLWDRTYGLGHAKGLSVDQVLPVVARYGAPKQQRTIRRFNRVNVVTGSILLVGTLPFLGVGFIGPQQLALRQGLLTGGLACSVPALTNAIVTGRPSHRLVEAYIDTLLSRHHYRVPAKPIAWTLADTIYASPRGEFLYRGVDIKPTEQLGDRPGFSWSHYQAMNYRPATILGPGLLSAGVTVLAYASLIAAGSDRNMRPTAWVGAGLLASGIVVMRFDGRRANKHLLDAVRLHNEQLRENDRTYFRDVSGQ